MNDAGNNPPARTAPPAIRLATAADLPAINAIYNHYVLGSTCTYQEEPSTEAERTAWFDARGPQHPVTVAATPEGEVLGWGSLSKFHPRSAYGRTVENGIYVRDDCRRRGVGRALLADLVGRARAGGHHTILALIDAEQSGSVALHLAFGFTPVARLRQVGFKFGRWLDVIYMQKLLAGDPSGA